MTIQDDPFKAIRTLKNSALKNHKMMYALLISVEEALREAKSGLSMPAYFSALLPLMKIPPKNVKATEQDFQATVVYLLASVFPRLPHSTILEGYALIHANVTEGFQEFKSVAPYVKSLFIVCKAVILSVVDDPARTSINDFFAVLLTSALDARPKVRKMAHQFIAELFQNTSCAQRFGLLLAEYVKACILNSSKKDYVGILHVLPLVKLLSFFEPVSSTIPDALQHVLAIKHVLCTQAVLEIIPDANITVQAAAKIYDCLCENSEFRDPHWYSAFSKTASMLMEQNADFNAQSFVGAFVPEPDAPLENWDHVCRSFEHHFAANPHKNAVIRPMLKKLEGHFRLMHTHVKRKTADNFLGILKLAKLIVSLTSSRLDELSAILELLKDIFNLRTSGKFRAEIVLTIGEAVKSAGLEYILGLFVDEDLIWILPAIRDNAHSTKSALFTDRLLPLVDRLHKKYSAKELDGTTSKKIETIKSQIWSCLPALCKSPIDLRESFGGLFNLLTRSASEDPSITMNVLQSLQNICNTARPSDEDFLASQAKLLLPFVLNIFSSAPLDKRAFVSEVISAILKLTPISDSASLHSKLLSRIEKLASAENAEGLEALLQLESLFVSTDKCFASAFAACDIFKLLQSTDVAIQKQTYKLMCAAVANLDASASLYFDKLFTALASSAANVLPGTQKMRINLLMVLSSVDSFFHTIPLFLPEVILSLKDNNIKTRQASFGVLVNWASIMSTGKLMLAGKSAGTIDSDRQASVNEFALMISAGLAGKTPHMISATILAIGRILFSYHAQIYPETIHAILSDVCVFLNSASREIVKSAIGLVKIAVVCLPIETSKEHIVGIVGGLLNWSSIHHQNFKVKTRHIIERMIRKFGFAQVLAATPEDHLPLLRNLEKRQERSRKKKAEPGRSAPSTAEIEGASSYGKFIDGSSESELFSSDNPDLSFDDVEVEPFSEKDADKALRRALKRKLSNFRLGERTKAPKTNSSSDDAVEDDYRFERLDGGKFKISQKENISSEDDFE